LIAATNYAAVIRPLQIIIMGVAGLFLLRVMRVAMVEVRPPKSERGPRRAKRQRQRGALALTFIEPEERAGERVDVDRPVVVGRGVECDLVLNDTYLSTRHAQFTFDEGDLLIEDLGSTNGSYVNQEMIAHRTRLSRGDIVQVGGVLFEVVR
jgi:pSer/pThr/pTyr-binding forkhead associated (FHA) protein